MHWLSSPVHSLHVFSFPENCCGDGPESKIGQVIVSIVADWWHIESGRSEVSISAESLLDDVCIEGPSWISASTCFISVSKSELYRLVKIFSARSSHVAVFANASFSLFCSAWEFPDSVSDVLSSAWGMATETRSEAFRWDLLGVSFCCVSIRILQRLSSVSNSAYDENGR